MGDMEDELADAEADAVDVPSIEESLARLSPEMREAVEAAFDRSAAAGFAPEEPEEQDWTIPEEADPPAPEPTPEPLSLLNSETSSVVDAVMDRFGDAENTLVLDRSHRAGVERGKSAEAFVARLLGVPLAASDSPYDLKGANGDRIDVKATRRGRPLMVPRSQGYKVDPRRVDAFVLVWDGGVEPEVVGQISARLFAESHRVDGPPKFPIETMYVDIADLRAMPTSWYAL